MAAAGILSIPFLCRHPDKAGTAEEKAAQDEIMKEINNARDVLNKLLDGEGWGVIPVSTPADPTPPQPSPPTSHNWSDSPSDTDWGFRYAPDEGQPRQRADTGRAHGGNRGPKNNNRPKSSNVPKKTTHAADDTLVCSCQSPSTWQMITRLCMPVPAECDTQAHTLRRMFGTVHPEKNSEREFVLGELVTLVLLPGPWKAE